MTKFNRCLFLIIQYYYKLNQLILHCLAEEVLPVPMVSALLAK